MTRHRSFREFWPSYLRDHAQPATRRFHYAGTALVVLIAIAAIVARDWRLILAVPAAGYGFAWFSHAFVERNRPATFTYPLWSLAADFRMTWLWATGRIERELEAAGVRPDREERARDGA